LTSKGITRNTVGGLVASVKALIWVNGIVLGALPFHNKKPRDENELKKQLFML
jgi:hypothetical protein